MEQLYVFWNTKNPKNIEESIRILEKDKEDSIALLQKVFESLGNCRKRLSNNTIRLERGRLSEIDQIRIKRKNEEFKIAIETLEEKITTLSESIDNLDKRIEELKIQGQLESLIPQATNNPDRYGFAQAR